MKDNDLNQEPKIHQTNETKMNKEEQKTNIDLQDFQLKNKISPNFLKIQKIFDEFIDVEFMNILDNFDLEKNCALGCITGAFIGDSIGSFLEFLKNPSQFEVAKAMKMEGGGPFSLNPGQVTDDSEIALCLAQGLIEGKGKLDLDHIAAYYGKWLNSSPFDLGNTIGTAFQAVRDFDLSEPHKHQLSSKMTSRAAISNISSQSNGCLMRITPLAVWCRNLNDEDIVSVVSREIQHTHSHKTVIEASVLWVLALVKLMNIKEDKTLDEESNIRSRMELTYKYIQSKIKENSSNEIKSWWDLVENETFMKANINIGFVKIAWTYGFIFLKQKAIDYEKVIEEMIAKGGDTDTNACIVGGLIGSAIGLRNIKAEYIEKMMKCDVLKSKNSRDPFFNPKNGLKLGNMLFDIAPKSL